MERKPDSNSGVGFGIKSSTDIPGEIGLGWLRFTCPAVAYQSIVDFIKRFFKVDLFDRRKGWNGYLMSWQGSYSIMVGLTPILTVEQRESMGIRRSPNEGYMTVEIPQSALDTLSLSCHWEMWLEMMAIDGLKIKRVDVFYDDFNRELMPLQLKQLVESRQVSVPRVRDLKCYEKFDLLERKNCGSTVYFGSAKSEKQVRFYDKFAESGGKKKCNRLEVQLVNGKAAAMQEWLFAAMAASLDCTSAERCAGEVVKAYRECIVGSIDFLDTSNFDPGESLPSNWAGRCNRIVWWKKIVTNINKANLSVSRVKPSLSDKVDWLKSQVFTSLSLVREVYRNWQIPWNCWITSELDSAESRWSDRHWKLFQEALVTSPAV